GAQADLLRVLQKQAVEISRATQPFSVTVTVRRATGGRGGRGAGAGAASDSAAAPPATATETRTFPAGSYIIRMDQPYSRIADALLDYQYWSPNDPQKNPYDDTGWTFPEGFAVQAVRVVDTMVLQAPHTVLPPNATITAPGGVSGTGSVYAVNANADNALATLRYKMPAADFQAAEEPFDANGQHFNRGSFLIRTADRSSLDNLSKTLGLKVTALSSAPSVK